MSISIQPGPDPISFSLAQRIKVNIICSVCYSARDHRLDPTLARTVVIYYSVGNDM